MPSNLELKAKIPSIDAAEAIAKKINAQFVELLFQTDTYFKINYGKLKLREFSDKISELIYYDRYGTDRWQSDYIIADISDIKNLKKILSLLFDITVIVKKRRIYYRFENSRIHLDTVENLGTFIEFEVLINEGDIQARNLLDKLFNYFNIQEKDIIRSSYSDLLLNI